MQFENNINEKFIICHGVVDLRKGSAGLLALIDNPQRGTWYLFSNRTRTLLKCVRIDRYGIWMGTRRLNHGHFCWLERAVGASTLTHEQMLDLCAGKKLLFYENTKVLNDN